MLKQKALDIANFRHSPAFIYAMLAFIVLLAAALRLFLLGSYSFWIDEVITIYRARAVLEEGFAVMIQSQPSTVMIGGVLAVLPTSEWSARLAPALIGIVTLPLLFFPMRRLYGNGPALIAIFIIALSQWHITWSQNSRFYTALMLFYGLSLLYFVISFEERKPGYFVLSGLFLILAFLERATALLAVPVLVSYLAMMVLFFQKDKFRISFPQMALIAVVPVALFAMYDLSNVLFAGRDSIVFQFYENFFGQSNVATFGALGLGLAIVFRLGVPLVCLGGIGVLYTLFFERNSRSMFLLLAVFVPLILLIVMATFSLARERYYVFAGLPFWALLAGLAINHMFSQPERYTRLVALGLLVFIFADGMSQSMLYYFYQNGNRPDYRTAYEIVESHRSPEADLVTTHHQQLIVEYYLGQPSLNAYDIDVAALSERSEPIWFVVEPVVGPTPPELLAWLDANARLIDVVDVDIPAAPEHLKIYAYNEDSLSLPAQVRQPDYAAEIEN